MYESLRPCLTAPKHFTFFLVAAAAAAGGGGGGMTFLSISRPAIHQTLITIHHNNQKMFIRLDYSSYRYVFYEVTIHLIIAIKLTENQLSTNDIRRMRSFRLTIHKGSALFLCFLLCPICAQYDPFVSSTKQSLLMFIWSARCYFFPLCNL